MVNSDTSGSLHLEIVTPTKRVLELNTQEVYFPTPDGRLGVLKNHVNLVCQVGVGVVFFNSANETQFLSVAGGIAQVAGNRVTLLVDVAEDGANIDYSRAEQALARSRSRLSGKVGKEEMIWTGHSLAKNVLFQD